MYTLCNIFRGLDFTLRRKWHTGVEGANSKMRISQWLTSAVRAKPFVGARSTTTSLLCALLCYYACFFSVVRLVLITIGCTTTITTTELCFVFDCSGIADLRTICDHGSEKSGQCEDIIKIIVINPVSYLSFIALPCLLLCLCCPLFGRACKTAEIFDAGLTELFEDVDDSDKPENPIAMHISPDGEVWWVAGKEGMLKEVSNPVMGKTRRKWA